MAYILYNRKLKRPLMHPQVGLWFTDNKQEAESLLADFHKLCEDLGHPEMIKELVVSTIEDK